MKYIKPVGTLFFIIFVIFLLLNTNFTENTRNIFINKDQNQTLPNSALESAEQTDSQENDYCSQFSGFHSFAWGGGSEKCEANGCRVIIVRQIDDPRAKDDEGFEYKCVAK